MFVIRCIETGIFHEEVSADALKLTYYKSDINPLTNSLIKGAGCPIKFTTGYRYEIYKGSKGNMKYLNTFQYKHNSFQVMPTYDKPVFKLKMEHAFRSLFNTKHYIDTLLPFYSFVKGTDFNIWNTNDDKLYEYTLVDCIKKTQNGIKNSCYRFIKSSEKNELNYYDYYEIDKQAELEDYFKDENKITSIGIPRIKLNSTVKGSYKNVTISTKLIEFYKNNYIKISKTEYNKHVKGLRPLYSDVNEVILLQICSSDIFVNTALKELYPYKVDPVSNYNFIGFFTMLYSDDKEVYLRPLNTLILENIQHRKVTEQNYFDYYKDPERTKMFLCKPFKGTNYYISYVRTFSENYPITVGSETLNLKGKVVYKNNNSITSINVGETYCILGIKRFPFDENNTTLSVSKSNTDPLVYNDHFDPSVFHIESYKSVFLNNKEKPVMSRQYSYNTGSHVNTLTSYPAKKPVKRLKAKIYV